MTGSTIVFVILALLAISSAILVILSPDPVHSALWLILNLVCLGVMYYGLDAPFLMAAQLIVYAGAIVVLFLFVVMVLNARGEDVWARQIPWLRSVGLVVALALFGGLWWAVKSAPTAAIPTAPDNVRVVGTVAGVGELLYSDYLLPFEATSVLLLAALVGALYLGRNEARRRGEPVSPAAVAGTESEVERG